MSHEDIRFGMVAVQKGIVTPEQVVRALQSQVEENLTTGGHRRIGEILCDRNELSRQELEDILEALRRMRIA